jgi:hypothetical protein
MILILPNGLYDENELNNYIQEYFGTFETPPFYFDVNYATNRFMLIIRYIGPYSPTPVKVNCRLKYTKTLL